MTRRRSKSKPRFYRQETPDSCAVACLRSVLDAYGHVVDEAELRQRCGTSSAGTLSDDVVACANFLGFEAYKEYSSLELLQQHIAKGRFPILYINLLLIDDVETIHAVIAIKFADPWIHVIDPLEGERKFPLSSFEQCWQKLNNLAIIISPSL